MNDVRTSSRSPVVGTVLLVALLAGLAAGAWALWGGRPLPAVARNVELTGEAGRRAAGPLALADFESGVESYEHITTFGQIAALKVLDGAEVDAYREAGAGPARMTLSSHLPRGRVLISAVRVRDHASAVAAADRLDTTQLGFGLVRGPVQGGVARVAVLQPGPDTDPAAKPTIRAHYASGDVVVRVEFNARSFDRQDAFADVLDRQLKVLPADG